MTRLFRMLVAATVAGGLSGCTSSDDPSESSSSQAVLHFTVAAVTDATDPLMAYIAVQNVFDPSEVFLVDCYQKSHQLDGSDFCDELLVVPPGVYEIIVQATDPTCRAEQGWYKVVVEANTTTEVPITLVCGGDTGGLDVVVSTEYAPSVVGISFTIDGVTANKYICQGVCAEDVTAVVQVYDADSPCAELYDYSFTAVDALGNDVTATLIAGTSATPDSVCVYSAVIDAQAPLGDYTITFRVTDPEGHTASLSFPVHLIDCGERLYFENTAEAAGIFDGVLYQDFDSAHFNIDSLLAGATFLDGFGAVFQAVDPIIGGVDLGNLPAYLLFFANGATDANWQGATKGYVGDVGVDGIQASERTSGTVPYAGVMYTNDITFGPWQNIINANLAQASGVTGQVTRISGLESDLVAAIQQVNALTPTPGFASRSSTSLDGLNTQNGLDEVLVINVTSGLSFSTQIDITGDAGDVFILRWDSDGNPANGYQGIANPSSGGAIVPHGGLRPSNFINVAGDINSSGGGTTPPPPYPQGPRYDDGLGDLIIGGSDFSGGGFFTGYWLTTGAPDTLDPESGLYVGDTQPLSNGIFVGGWYTLTTKFSMTSGTSGVYVSPNPPTVVVPAIDVEKYVSVDGGTTWFDADLPTGPVTAAGGTVLFRFVVTNTGNATLTSVTVTDDVYGSIGTLPSLAIGASYTFPDLSTTALAGQHVDTATATGTYLGETYTDTDPAHYYGSTEASIDVEKLVSVDGGATWYDADSPTGPVAPVGVDPMFRFVITNTGTTTMTSVTLTDDVYGDLTGSLLTTTLAPGESTSVELTGTWAAGQHTDVATTTGVSDSTTYTDSDPANYFGALSPAIDLEKYVSVDGGTTWLDADTPPGPISPVGGADPILFKFVVTNTGNATLHDIVVTDDVFGLIGTLATLAPGASYEFPWASEPRTEGQHMDTGTATAVYDSTPVSDTDPAYYFGETSGASIDVEKLVSADGCVTLDDADAPTGPAVPIGTNPCYRFVITNTGTETLNDITLTDTVFGDLTLLLPVTTLAVGASTYVDVTGTWALGQNYDEASVTAVPEISGGTVTDSDPAYYWGLVAPGLDVEKLVSVDGGVTWLDADLFPGPYLPSGQVPMFRYVITNTGDVPIDFVTLTDDVYGHLADYGTLLPGESRVLDITGTDPYQCL